MKLPGRTTLVSGYNAALKKTAGIPVSWGCFLSISSNQRVLSGMRPTGQLHLGHYHGVLKNWVQLQHEYECFFFVAEYKIALNSYLIVISQL